jgi:hypothetical protein
VRGKLLDGVLEVNKQARVRGDHLVGEKLISREWRMTIIEVIISI